MEGGGPSRDSPNALFKHLHFSSRCPHTPKSYGLTQKAPTLLIPPFILFWRSKIRGTKKRKVVRSDVHSFFCSLFRDIVPSASKGRLFLWETVRLLSPFFRGPRVLGDTLSRALSQRRKRERGWKARLMTWFVFLGRSVTPHFRS